MLKRYLEKVLKSIRLFCLITVETLMKTLNCFGSMLDMKRVSLYRLSNLSFGLMNTQQLFWCSSDCEMVFFTHPHLSVAD